MKSGISFSSCCASFTVTTTIKHFPVKNDVPDDVLFAWLYHQHSKKLPLIFDSASYCWQVNLSKAAGFHTPTHTRCLCSWNASWDGQCYWWIWLPSVLPVPMARRTWGNLRWLLIRSIMSDKEAGSLSVQRRPIPVCGRRGWREKKFKLLWESWLQKFTLLSVVYKNKYIEH